MPIARDGSLRVVQAALEENSVERIVMVSSIVAVMYWDGRPKPVFHLKETDWSDPDWERFTWAYAVSKTRAEKAVWELVRQLNVESKLVSVNPAMVWGPLVEKVECTSSDICKLFLQGHYPFNVPVDYPVVDVRDVAAVIVAAISAPVGGRRLIAAADAISFADISKVLAESFPQYASKIPKWTAPKWLIRVLALFDPQLRQILLDLDTRAQVDSSYVTDLTGVEFRPASEAIRAMAESLIEKNLI